MKTDEAKKTSRTEGEDDDFKAVSTVISKPDCLENFFDYVCRKSFSVFVLFLKKKCYTHIF